MATKTEKKNQIRQDIIAAAAVYSRELAGKTFLYVYGNEYFEVSFPINHFLHLTGVETRLSAREFYRNAKKGFLTVNDLFLPRSLRVEDSSIEKSGAGEIVDFIFAKDASLDKYDCLLVCDESKRIPEIIFPLLEENLYLQANI